MPSAIKDYGYQFSEGFDRAFLEDIYGDDSRAAEEIFHSSICQIEQSMERAGEIMREGTTEQLRQHCHHLKPVFGYIGQLHAQGAVQRFEELCSHVASLAEVHEAYSDLTGTISAALELVRREHLRLKEHNNRRA
jgi:hypothetical protein